QGASGWVAASAWLTPTRCVDLWRAADEERWGDAVQLWDGLAGPLGQIESDPAFISLIKRALGELGLEQGPVRPPLPQARDVAGPPRLRDSWSAPLGEAGAAASARSHPQRDEAEPGCSPSVCSAARAPRDSGMANGRLETWRAAAWSLSERAADCDDRHAIAKPQIRP